MAREPRKDDGLPLNLRKKNNKKTSNYIDSTAIIYPMIIGVLVSLLVIITLFCGGNTANKDKSINELYDRISILNKELESQKYKVQRLQEQNILLNNRLKKN